MKNLRLDICDKRNTTPRDIVEERLLNYFPSTLAPLPLKSGDILVQRYIGYVSAFLNQHTPLNTFSTSSKYPNGLMFAANRASFGIMVIFETHSPHLPRIHIICPKGENSEEAVKKFKKHTLDLMPEAVFLTECGYADNIFAGHHLPASATPLNYQTA